MKNKYISIFSPDLSSRFKTDDQQKSTQGKDGKLILSNLINKTISHGEKAYLDSSTHESSPISSVPYNEKFVASPASQNYLEPFTDQQDGDNLARVVSSPYPRSLVAGAGAVLDRYQFRKLRASEPMTDGKTDGTSGRVTSGKETIDSEASGKPTGGKHTGGKEASHKERPNSEMSGQETNDRETGGQDTGGREMRIQETADGDIGVYVYEYRGMPTI